MWLQERLPLMAYLLTTLIGVNQNLFLRIMSPHGHRKRIQDNIFCHPTFHWPSDNFAREKVNNLGQIQPAFVGSDVSYVRYLAFTQCFGLNCRWCLLGITIQASPLHARGLRYPTWAFIPARFISRQPRLIPHCCPLSRRSRWILR